MSLDPRSTGAPPLRERRATAQREARTLSGAVVAIAGGGIALLAVALFVVLDYGLNQDPHRIAKVMAGAAVVTALALRPRIGLFVLPLAVPFLEALPRIPVPILNPV